jgi:hypothetical protein
MAAGFTQYPATQRLSGQLQFVVHELATRNPIVLDIVRTTAGVLVANKGIGTATPTGNPFTASTSGGETVYWEKMAKFIVIGSTDEELAIYYNTGTRAAPVWTATDTAITKADILALIGSLDHAHTSSATGTFTATATTADVTTAVHDAAAATNGTPLYVAALRGQVLPGVFTSENAGAATANLQAAPGTTPYPVVYRPTEEATLTITQDASALTNGSQVYVEPISPPNQWGAQIGRIRAQSAGRVNGTFATSAPVDTLEIEHFQEDTAQIGIPLNNLRLLAGGTIPNTAANGGVISADTDPVASVTSDSGRIAWAAASVVAVEFQVPIPTDFDGGKDAILMVTAGKDADNNAVDIGISTSWDDAAAVADSVVDIPQATSVNLITIAAADIPANPGMLTCILTPGAHAGDAVYIYSIKLQYSRTHNLLPVYFDHDNATDTSRLQCVNPLGKNIYVPLASGRLLKITHSATAAADGALLRYDHDAAASAFLISTLATTTCETGNQLGFWNWYGIYLVPIYVNETSPKFAMPVGTTPTDIPIPVWSIVNNREFKIYNETITVQPRAYFDDDAATASQRVLAVMVGTANVPIPSELYERPFWIPPAGAVAVTPTVNTSGALIV